MAVQTIRAQRIAGSRRSSESVVSRSKSARVVSPHAAIRQPERDLNPTEQMCARLRACILSAAEGWAHHAFLRDGATNLIEAFGTVEDALLTCMFYQTMLAELEE